MPDASILIAGGGIGGLAAAIGLANAGFRVVVLEKAAQFGETGAGIQLGPNAFHALDALGIGPPARASAVYIDQLKLMDALTAREIAHIDLGAPFEARFNNPYAVVHRGELHGVILRACENHPLVELHTEAEVTDYKQNEIGVAARLTSGKLVIGTALIGADGLRSRIRQQVLADGAPRVSGHSTYRSVIPLDDMPEALRWNAATLWAGPKCHIVHYPLSGWKSFNLVVTCHNHAPEAVAGMAVSEDEVRRGFAHIHETPREIISRGRDWRLWVLCDRDPAERWTDGRVALLGDAAHPMLQYFAQGACMALEDAVSLSRHIADDPGGVVAALKRYNAERLTRTARVQLMSREIGDHIYHPAGAHARLRDEIMGAKSSADFYDALAWLYNPPSATATSAPARDGY